MNRVIRFRAWDKELCIMFTIKDLAWPHAGGSVVRVYSAEDLGALECGQNSGQYTRYIDDVILMQYTGLKDKNGVEIYEGDIVGLGEMTGVVEWVPDSAAFNLGGWRFADRCEVIGNIYENPQLLERTA